MLVLGYKRNPAIFDYLVPKASGPAVDHDHDLSFAVDAHLAGGELVEDLVNDLEESNIFFKKN